MKTDIDRLRGTSLAGRYRILAEIGQGGMGIVYRAHDQRLNRFVALKMIRRDANDATARTRLWREARTAATLSHPHLCRLYDIHEEAGELFLTMELLDGESLSARLKRGQIALAEAIEIGLAILSALSEMHQRHLAHRDLKPSNVFLTSNGVKLLDFGLTRRIPTELTATETNLTMAGAIVGTPAYMAPEQVFGQPVDGRSDLFALGCVLFEMLTATPAFRGDSIIDVLHAITSEQPPMLTGSPCVVAVGRIVHRALAKNPDDRPATAAEMADALRATLRVGDEHETVTVRAMSRIMVLPFRQLRPDPELEFLPFGLADAITTALAGLDSVIVRSTLTAAQFAAHEPSWQTIAADANVDVVLAGTLLRVNNELRVTAQLVETPSGRVVWSRTTQVSVHDLFRLQDDLASAMIDALALPLTAREQRLLNHDAPTSAKAYELYLRANPMAEQGAWTVARDLYVECLQEDHRFAPGWARLGRVYRLLGKFGGHEGELDQRRAEEAFGRALSINPDLSIAHNQYARLEIDLGRATDAMARLLGRLRVRRTDPEIFAALVQACRYCGLLDASVAAHEAARRLDPRMATSVAHSYVMLGRYHDALHASGDPLTRAMVLMMLGRKDDSVAVLREVERMDAVTIRTWATASRLLVEGHRDEGLRLARTVLPPSYKDPESRYYLARQLAQFGDREAAVGLIREAVEGGFFCVEALTTDPWLESVRNDSSFQRTVVDAARRHAAARAVFGNADGSTLLGVTLPVSHN